MRCQNRFSAYFPLFAQIIFLKRILSLYKKLIEEDKAYASFLSKEELEKMSFKSIFVSIFQDKDEKLIKERYEASQASLEYQRVLLNFNLNIK